jgi:phosphate transport system permease protein
MSAPSLTLMPISARRRRVDRLGRLLLGLCVLLAVVPLVLVLFFIVRRGIGALSVEFFTTDPSGRFLGNPGGIRSAIVGTIEIVALASAIAVPLGVGVALWLVEFGRGSPLARMVRYFVDVLTGVPSIVFGLFIYIVLILSGHFGGFSGWKGSLALALLMLPVVTRSAEVALTLVPHSLREAALALGSPRWRLVFRIVLPTALPGILTGALLAIARAAGETAPLLFTVLGAQALTVNLSQQMNSLPLQIFNDVRAAQDRLVTRAWGAALTLILMILILNVLARVIARRSRLS